MIFFLSVLEFLPTELVNFKSDKFNHAPGTVLEFYGNGARSRPVIEKKIRINNKNYKVLIYVIIYPIRSCELLDYLGKY